MSQFAFLQAEFPDIFAHATRAENLANSDPRAAAVYGRTHNKDSFAAKRPRHSTTSRVSPMRLGARFDRRTTLRLKLTGLAARSPAAKTRMNIEFS
jgi:hypothetical protein